MEFFLFFALAGVDYAGGMIRMKGISHKFPENPLVAKFANLSFVVTSAMVNFVARGYLVFKGEARSKRSPSP